MDSTRNTTLADLHSGEQATITSLGRGSGIQGRLTALGFTPGAKLTVMQNYGRGPLVVALRGARVALGRREAGAIQVLPLPI
jgi:Fe2+ transport system protein FeoA